MNMIKKHRSAMVLFSLVLLGLIAGPFLISQYWMRVLTGIFMYAALAQATNIVMGYSGLVPFGNVVFFGMGAYFTGFFMITAHLPFFVALVLGALVSSAFAALIGHPILKLKGHYFAIATMGVSEAAKQIASNVEITGGGMGYNLPLIPLGVTESYYFFYFLMLMLVICVTVTAYWVSRNRIGYALRTVMYNEEGGQSLGINTAYYKVVAWGISAFFTALVGGVYAYWYGYIDPPTAFDIVISVRFIIMIMLGGAGTILGPILGAFFVELLSETIWSQFLYLHLGILGGIIILVVIFMPKGVMWFYSQRFSLNALLENVRTGKL
jgi:branched-chain amino acid transport system permease protein